MAATSHPDLLFSALDACHQQMLQHLLDLQHVAEHLEAQGLDEADRKLAGVVQEFFSSTSREHHEMEETKVFPGLLAQASPELKAVVQSLQQDHGFIEENWIELGPQLRGIAEGNDWFDVAEFLHNVEVFLQLVSRHIVLEESLIYPEAKARTA